MKHLILEAEELEQRIAPGVAGSPCDCDCKEQGNNGYGNGGDDGVPGRSADNNSPNAGEKAADEVR